MRTELLSLGVLAIGAIDGISAAGLKIAKIDRPAQISDAVIVGRAVCSGSTWLLSEARQLTEVRHDGQVVAHKVTGLATTEEPWGLACLSDGTFWTMAEHRTLARIDGTGRVQERIDLQLPRTTLYAVGDRLLFQPRPAVAGMAALMTSPPRRPYAVKPWAGLVIPRARNRDRNSELNVTLCGINVDSLAPCWFSTAMQFAISDGTAFRFVDVAAPLRSMPVDPELPIRDVALTSADGYWLLAGGRDAERGRASGIRLFRIREKNSEQLFIDLKPTARIILNASDTRCVLLTVDGSLMEVVVTP